MKTIITNKMGAGRYKITIMDDHKEIGTFETTDMQLVDDIKEINDGGDVENLMMHETFDEVVETCLSKIKL